MEDQIRLAAFDWLRSQIGLRGETLPREILTKGFEFKGDRITLVGPAGIWIPKQFSVKPISITTILNGPYPDAVSEDGFLRYKYRGRDPLHRDNVGLREAWIHKTALIYFVNLSPGYYKANFPVFVIHDSPGNLEFTIALPEQKFDFKTGTLGEVNDYLLDNISRRYNTRVVEQRVFQPVFRHRVLSAYDSRCCLCKLNHSELLDAAHIIPDSEPKGDPIVPNGLTLCKIHHAAFDANIIGVSPDYEIKVRTDILEEIDGPMLKHGIQELNNHKIILPSHRRDYPDKERLEWRFDRFNKAS